MDEVVEVEAVELARVQARKAVSDMPEECSELAFVIAVHQLASGSSPRPFARVRHRQTDATVQAMALPANVRQAAVA